MSRDSIYMRFYVTFMYESHINPTALLSAIQVLSDWTGDQLEALHMRHNSRVGHGGVDRTVAYLTRLGHTWPSMRRDTKQFIKICPFYQKLNAAKTAISTIKFTTSTYEPRMTLDMDFIGPSPTGEYILYGTCCNYSTVTSVTRCYKGKDSYTSKER